MKLVERKYLLSFIVITCLFALWGFANDITNPLADAPRRLSAELTAYHAPNSSFFTLH